MKRLERDSKEEITANTGTAAPTIDSLRASVGTTC